MPHGGRTTRYEKTNVQSWAKRPAQGEDTAKGVLGSSDRASVPQFKFEIHIMASRQGIPADGERNTPYLLISLSEKCSS